ncbi:MAG: adenylate/guanylate cyclase domain-containing protein [Acidimicrobiales bacterium]
MRQPPSGTVTFLFTDIEGSTRLWEDRPDDMRAALIEHDTIVRTAIDAHAGYVFSTGGDGFGAAFGRAADAVDAARVAQEALAGHPMLKVRMGINSGEVHERDGDYFGPPVNRTARLMAAAHGGQVLLSAVTAELVPGLVLQNLGEHRLRDLGSAMMVWQLGTGDFPTLRTLDELPGNLPVQRTSFVGRVDEVKELVALVGSERLVTLTGPGGVGKSRLALQVAAELAPVYRDGVWFASLASLAEGELVAATILQALDVPERRGEPALDTLCGWARTREALLVIDNCEHLAAAVAGDVDALLEASSTTSVLATSQAPLGVRGEHMWAVAPLSGSKSASHDSVELFVDRARMARAGFELTADNEDAVVEICERLDHLPLAIELAAARVRGMTPADIARRLDQRLRLFATTDRAAPGRHRTLDAAVRWSYELCDETQRRVFDRLSVFAGPFKIDAAEVVVSGEGVEDWEVLDAVLALVDKSLVVVDETDNDARYRLFETMRQFGHANLTTAAIQQHYRDRHADYYIDFVLSRRAQLHGKGDIAARAAVEDELENIRVALRHAADDHTSARFEQLFISLYTVWSLGRLVEGAAWVAALQGRATVDPAASILALGFASSMMLTRNMSIAEDLVQAAEDLWLSTRAAPPVVAISVASATAMMQGRNADAIEGCERALSMASDEHDPFVRGSVLSTCYAVLALCGSGNRLEALEQELTTVVEALGNRYFAAATSMTLVSIVGLTAPERAGELLRQTFVLNDEMRNHSSNSSVAMYLAFHELRAGDTAGAAHWAARSLQLAVDHGPGFIAQAASTTVAIVKRRSPRDAALLLGALQAHRARKHQPGTQIEADRESRQEMSLRRALDDQFEVFYSQGLDLGEDEMIAFAFEQLGVMTHDPT